MAGTGLGAKRGILFKSGDSFERAKNLTLVVFDKTGTLTKGLPAVARIISNPEFAFAEEKILKVGASLAWNSEHPLSKAVVMKAKEKGIAPADFKNTKELAGRGLTAFCAEHQIPVMLGNKKLL
jgi:cation transport ATPase